MHALAKFSLKNRALIALVTVSVAVFGWISLGGLKQELVPSIELPQLVVVTNYGGASPEVVNQDVSTPIESVIQSVPGLESTVATSGTGRSMITATFEYGTDLATAEQKVMQAIGRIKSMLPENLDPQVVTFSFSDLPVMQIAVSSGENAATLADDLEQLVVPELEKLDGVREAAMVGATGQRITIVPDPDKLEDRGVTTQNIIATLSASGVLVPAGDITANGITLPVQAGTKLAAVGDIAKLPMSITTANRFGIPETKAVRIEQVASVKLVENPVTSISRVNGEPALTIVINKLPSANTVDVSHAVQDALPALADAIPGVSFSIVFDQAPYIEESIEALTTEGLLGLVFAVLVILVFLFSFRSTIVTAISIPSSVLIALIGMSAADYTLNMLTLGGLTIAIGRVVDDSIVVIENIQRHLNYGKERKAAILEAVREVAGAITASTITTVAVFLPISFVSGTAGEMFRPFALTISMALLASLLVALTIVPVLAYWFLRARPDAIDEENLPVDAPPSSRLQRGYLPIIRWTLRYPVVVLMAAVMILGGTLALAPLMKTNFLGSMGQNTLNVSQSIPQETSLDAALELAELQDEALRELDGIETVQLSIGSTGSFLGDAFGGGGSGSITYAITTDPDADQDELQQQVRATMTSLVEDPATISISSTGGMGMSTDIEVNITGPRHEVVEEATTMVLEKLAGLEVTAQATSNLAETRPFLQVEVKRRVAAEHGLSEGQLTQLVSQAMQPTQIGRIELDERSVNVYLVAKNAPKTLNQLNRLTVDTVQGEVRLDKLASISQVEAPTTITTVGGLRSATVSITPNDDDLGTASLVIEEALAELELPAGANVEIGGVTATMTDSFEQLGIALLVAVLIVYIIMVATFRSLLQPLLLLVSVPFAATGAILLQLVADVPLGVPSLIGVLMLIGIVVTNAIVLVDLVNQYREKGMSVFEALVLGSARRLRPILMTALATIFALVPMAIGVTGHSGFISQPLALIVIGGLVSSTVMTLLVLPVIYFLVENPRQRRRDRKAAELAAKQLAAVEAERARLPWFRRLFAKRPRPEAAEPSIG